MEYLEADRELEKQKEAERERLIREDMLEQNNRHLRLEKLDAAARRRLLCDVKAVQQQQREEKGKTYHAFLVCLRFIVKCLFSRVNLFTLQAILVHI